MIGLRNLLMLAILAVVVVYGFSFFPARFFFGFIIAMVSLIVVMIILIAMIERQTVRVDAPSGLTIQWRGTEGGRHPIWWVFLAIPDDPEHYIKVFDQGLYDAGIGYVTQQSHRGVKVERP